MEQPELWHWVVFCVAVAAVLLLDLTLFHRDSREPTLRNSAAWTVAWCSLALLFNALVWVWRGPETAIQFLNGYLIEWSLSMDNVFVFAVIFAFFRVPLKYQYRVLFWGILGAVLMRLSFILIGAQLLLRFQWVMVVFGGFLLYTAAKMVFTSKSEVHPDRNLLMRIARKLFPVSREAHGEKFFVREEGRRCMTPLFLVLLVVESTDVMFAVDSVPAIFSVVDPNDPFTMFSSNVFAILGLRALYFLLAGVMDIFRYLRYGLAGILAFVGGKMIADFVATHFEWTGPEEHLLPHWVSLAVIASLLALSITASVVAARRTPRVPEGPTGDQAPIPAADPPRSSEAPGEASHRH